MTNKNFDSWNIQKKLLESHMKEPVKFHERDVWWCSFGINLGNEQDGTGDNFERPCVIVKKLSPTTTLVAPLSTREKLEIFQVQVTIREKIGYVLLDQVRVVDAKSLLRKMGYIPKETFTIIRSKLKNLL